MISYDLLYNNALLDAEESIENILSINNIPIDSYIDRISKCPSSIDAWDYCFMLAIGLSGVFISTNDSYAQFLNEIHTAASTRNDCSTLQSFLGDILHHQNDAIDKVEKTFINRNGDNAWGLFHRLMWGHDILSLQKDNPFALMFKQKGIFGIFQALRHLIADTTSKQGLPLPGSSFLDYFQYDDNGNKKLTNYIINISQKLSQEVTGNKASAEKIYENLASIRAQDITAGIIVKALSESYFRTRNITDELRKAQFRSMAYAINFFGEAIFGCIKQNGVPYINYPLLIITILSLIRFYKIDSNEIKALNIRTESIDSETKKIVEEHDNLQLIFNSDNESNNIINCYCQAENNFVEFKNFLEGNSNV